MQCLPYAGRPHACGAHRLQLQHLVTEGGFSHRQPPSLRTQVCSWAIQNGRCYFRNRFVRTDAFCAEQAAGRMLFRGAFSAGDPSGRGGWFNPFDLTIKAIANTGVLHWAGRTFALHEVWAHSLP